MRQTIEALKKVISDLLEEEGITQADLDMVDLDIEFSPVIAIRGEKEKDAVEVIKSRGEGYYFVKHPFYHGEPISADALKVMRYRYLTNRKNPLLGLLKRR